MRRFGLIGRPLGHSASAAYFTEKFNKDGVNDCEYSLYELGSIGELPGLLERLPDLCGLNVTIPYKRDVMAFLDSVSPEAEAIGAVNCIRRTADGRLAGYNTDVIGIQLAFDHANRELGEHHTASRSGTALIIGNGNTATSALAACCMMPEIGHIVVAARHPGKNTGLKPVAEKFVNVHNPYNEIELGDDQALLEAARNATYVINTIPGHAADNVADALADAGTEPFSGLLLDVIYDPRPTKLMEAWRAHGGHAIGGEEMLLYQALVQVLLMTGIWDDDPPSDADQRLQDTTTEDDQLEIAMRKALEEAL